GVRFDAAGAPRGARPLDQAIAALRRGRRIRTVKQAIVDVAKRETVGWEFLSRLDASGFGSPADFFRIALEAGILTLVDHRCIRSAVGEAKALAPGTRRHFNIFPSTLIDVPVTHLLESFPQE